MSLEKSSSNELSRRTQPFYARKQSYNPSQQVQIEVDLQREFLDFENSRLFFDVTYTKGTNNFSLPSWTAASFIQNLRVKTLAGQMIGHEIREYRAWARMIKELMSNNENAATQGAEDLLEGAVALTAQSANLTTQYGHKLLSHLFSIKQYYPAHFHQGIMIEFDLPTAVQVMEDSISTLDHTFSVDNCRFVADLVQLKPEIENEMVKMMENQKLFVDYMEVLTQENALAAGSGENYDVVGIDGRVKAIFQYEQGSASARDGTTGDSYWDSKLQNGLAKYRFKLGANYLNYQNIDCDAANNTNREAIYELMKALDSHHEDGQKQFGSSIHDLGASPINFVVAVKVDKAQKNSDKVISSMIDKDRNNVRVELTTVTAATTSYTHISLDKRLQILPGSIVRNVRS